MIIHLPPDAPLALRVAADTALALHIGGATIGLITGAAAMAVRKGGRAHRLIGHVFTGAMLVMALMGAATAPFLPARFSILAGLLTAYLVATSWVAARRRPGQVGRFEALAAASGLGVAALGAVLAWMGAVSPDHHLDGLPYQPALMFVTLALLGAYGDLRVILGRGLAGADRLARHIWRMCAALLIAYLSFTAQPAAIPRVLHGSPLLFAPLIWVAIMMTWWLVRIRLTRRRKPRMEVRTA